MVSLRIVAVLLLVYCGLAQAFRVPWLSELLNERAWKEWRREHPKLYAGHTETVKRKAIFFKNMDMIRGHNLMHMLGLRSFNLGMNQFGDLTPEEFAERYLTLRPPTRRFGDTLRFSGQGTLPDTFDWRKYGAVTQIKNRVGITFY